MVRVLVVPLALAVVALAGVAARSAQRPLGTYVNPEEWQYSKEMENTTTTIFQIWYNVTAVNMTACLETESSGWAGFGFGDSLFPLSQADFIAGYVDGGSAVHVADYWRHPGITLDAQQDIGNVHGERDGTVLTLCWSRPLVPNENLISDQDIPITPDAFARYTWARGDAIPVDDDSVTEHVERGSIIWKLVEPDVEYVPEGEFTESPSDSAPGGLGADEVAYISAAGVAVIAGAASLTMVNKGKKKRMESRRRSAGQGAAEAGMVKVSLKKKEETPKPAAAKIEPAAVSSPATEQQDKAAAPQSEDAAEKRSSGNHSHGKRSDGKRSDGKRSDGKRSGGKRSHGKRSGGKRKRSTDSKTPKDSSKADK